MQVDWITVVAQIANFLILVWLLHRFLYGPITRAMERREERIRNRLDEARQQNERAEAKQRELDARLRDLDEQRQATLEEARREADALKRKLEQQVREDVDGKREAWIAELEDGRAEFLAELREKTIDEFRRLAEDAFEVLADTTLTDRMAEAFLRRLDGLAPEDVTRLADGARREGVVRIEASGQLDAGLRRRMTRAVHEVIADNLEVEYAEQPDGLVGIRMRAGSATLEWTIDAYLDRFAEELAAVFPKASTKRDFQADDGALSRRRAGQAASVETSHDG